MTDKALSGVIGMGVCTVDYLFTVPHMPIDGVSIKAGQHIKQPGGLVSTALATLAKLGISCEVVSRLGDDEEGHYIRDQLQREGIGTDYLLSEPDTVSHVVAVLVDEQTGERSFVSRWPTGSPLRVDEIPYEGVVGADILFVDSVNEATLAAASWAHESETWVVLDPSQPYDTLLPLLKLTDVPIVPESFAQDWMPDAPPEAVVKTLYEQGAKIAVLTLGERGCVVAWDDDVARFPALSIDVVDTTGAGDAFHGGFMYGMLQDWDMPQIVRFASAVGALNCRFLGGRAGLPTREEVDEFLQGRAG